MSGKPKPTKKRIRLTDDQVRIVLRDLRNFGYPSLTFESVRKTADQIAEGTHSPTNVIAVIIAKFIDDAQEMKAGATQP